MNPATETELKNTCIKLLSFFFIIHSHNCEVLICRRHSQWKLNLSVWHQ